MTYQEFLSKLEALDLKWELVEGGKRIRCGNKCPIEAVGCNHLNASIVELRLDNSLASGIIYAADGHEIAKATYPEMRQDLLRVCKLNG